MKILIIGDIIGNIGIKKVEEVLPNLKEEHGIDFIIANGENTADGLGINHKTFKNMLDLGIDAVTLGNHTWIKREVFNIIDSPKLIRPANYPKGVPGKGYRFFECNNKKICVINLLGRTDMSILSENPFAEINKIIDIIKSKSDIIILDFHAEATAEKIAMAYHIDGKVNAIVGTHTHVQTADEQILQNGTAYISDIGMTGPKKSVIGMDLKTSLKRFTTSLPERYKVAEGECIFNGCILTINDEDCRTQNIQRIYM